MSDTNDWKQLYEEQRAYSADLERRLEAEADTMSVTMAQYDKLCGEADEAEKRAEARIERLTTAVRSCLEVIDDYLAYSHDGDPWSEDARLMSEMDINYFANDGRRKAALEAVEQAGV